MADGMLDGTFDEQTGEYLGPPCGYPRTRVKGQYNTMKREPDTPEEAKIRKIRKELAILITKKHESCTTEKEKNKAVEDARHEINVKYGKGWREQSY